MSPLWSVQGKGQEKIFFHTAYSSDFLALETGTLLTEVVGLSYSKEKTASKENPPNMRPQSLHFTSNHPEKLVPIKSKTVCKKFPLFRSDLDLIFVQLSIPNVPQMNEINHESAAAKSKRSEKASVNIAVY